MLKNISNNLSATFNRSQKSTKTPIDSPPLATWPDDVTLPGEPLFTRPLTSADFDALQESAGLGPVSWWLDSELARSDPIDTFTYEDEISLTAMLRAPFEQAGPVRSAARGLIDRLNELERLQALAIEEERRRAQGKEKKVRHHSTLRLATEGDEEEMENSLGQLRNMSKPAGVSLQRRDTYAVTKREPLSVKQPQEGFNPRLCQSPERRDYRVSEAGELQRTFSKGSMHQLQVPGELQRSLNGLAVSDLSGNSTQLLGRTFDAEQLSDVFPSPRASTERFDSSVPPPKPSADLPREATRHMTFVRQPTQSRNLQRGETLVPRSSASPMRNGRPSKEPSNETPLRDSLPTRLNTSEPIPHKLSVPEMSSGLKTSGSGSNIIPTNMSDAMALMREQEMKLRASSGRTGEMNMSLASSIEGNGSAHGSTNRLNKSLPVDGGGAGVGGLSHMFNQREVKDVPQRYDPEGKRNAPGELSRNKSSSQSSLKDMASLNEMIKAQQESLRVSGEQIMQKVRSRSSLNRSIGGSSISSRDGSPQVPPISQKEPAMHQSIERPGNLHISSATYDLNTARISLNSSIPSEDLAQPQRTSSPVTMRRPPRSIGANIPPPLTLPVDIDSSTPETPQTAKTARPGSYVEQLQSATHASSAVEAWVADTMSTMNKGEVGIVNLSASGESFSGMRASTETYALPEEDTTKNICPNPLRAPPPKLVQPPQSLLTESIMTTSQKTVTAKSPTTSTGKPVARRGIAPAAIRGGRTATIPNSSATGKSIGVSSIRPPGIPRPRPPTGTSSTTAVASRLPAPRVAAAPSSSSNARPPISRLRPPTSVPRSRIPAPRGVSGTSTSRSTSRTNSRAP